MLRSDVLVLQQQQIAELVDLTAVRESAREAFTRLARGDVHQPGVLAFDVPEHRAEMHVKGAYVHGGAYLVVKVAGGFADNPARGLPANSGSVWLFDVTTGALRGLLLDNGLLTALRTGASGAVAADVLARTDIETVTVVGAGEQAYRQVTALLGVRSPSRVQIWARRPDAAQRCAARIASEVAGLDIRPADSLERAVATADIVITVTGARSPLIRAEWIRPGTHITAVGSDMPGKTELDASVLAGAVVVADNLEQCRSHGEIASAIAAGAIGLADVHGELGDILLGARPGRTAPTQTTVADLTGVGATDALLATYVMRRALAAHAGATLPLQG